VCDRIQCNTGIGDNLLAVLLRDPGVILDPLNLQPHLAHRQRHMADKAYDVDRIREMIQNRGATPNIPPKSNRRWKPFLSRRLYRERLRIERLFAKLKRFRRVATRHDKLARQFPRHGSPQCRYGSELIGLRPK
jgi:transposase